MDAKLVVRYACGRSKWTRVRRKRAGLSSAQSLRHGRLFVLLATAGEGEFFAHERATFRDARREPIRAFGYSAGSRGGHVSVRIDPGRYRELKARLLDLAPRLPADAMTVAFRRALRYEPFAGVRSQAACVLRAVNRARRDAGRETVPAGCPPTRRQVVRPFDPLEVACGLPTHPNVELMALAESDLGDPVWQSTAPTTTHGCKRSKPT